jgi:hypothetical protein
MSSRPYLSTGTQSQCCVTTEGHLASRSRCKAQSGAQDQSSVTVKQLLGCCCWASSLRREDWSTCYSVAFKVKVKVILRPIVSRPVHPGVRHPSGTRDQFSPFSFLLFLDSFGFVDVGRSL